jgi:pyruvate,water dikinase
MAQRRRAADDAWSAFAGRARGVRRPLRPLVRWLLGRAKAFGLWRERGRFEMTRVLSAVRRWHLALADRWVARGWIEMRDDYFLLTLAEVRRAIVDPAASAEWADLARRRRSEQEAWRRMDMPLLLRERELPTLLHRARQLELHDDGRRLEGMCVSGGCVEAEVAVIAEPTDFARMKRGAILVAAATDPSWTPLFTLAAGVIVEIGGTLSHASTVAREYGLPALANVRNATRILRSGDRVRLDATRGTVELLSRSHP